MEVKKVTYKKRKTDYDKIFKYKDKAELKCLDTPSDLQVYGDFAGNSGTILINKIQEGTGFYNRVGRHVNMKSLKVKGSFYWNGITGTSTRPDFLRLAVVYDRQPSNQASLPIYTDIFQAINAGGATVGNQILHDINANNRERFLILKDVNWQYPTVIASGSNTTSVVGTHNLGGNETNVINWFIDLEGLSTHFKSTNNPITLADITTGALYIVQQGTKTTLQASWNLQFVARLRYCD